MAGHMHRIDAGGNIPCGGTVDKDSKEALQVTKELVAKFIETRTISPGNFAELFPVIYKVVLATITQRAKDTA